MQERIAKIVQESLSFLQDYMSLQNENNIRHSNDPSECNDIQSDIVLPTIPGLSALRALDLFGFSHK